ncbi:hypothetical protein SODALDRAFT_355159 [Sodiomyces alkalinus F11]|uniref:Uncharacterized protein n=1 Tax=Sodiomyces alkalinus (strain CBS 110278 / VKM F-3762 / F11) TaxID=1314773 RepID=A0A3N2Q889_SODAK|nr:hypothetical protein SODALDRAFT_355159 [Sodiomyces alkalinus F11]ROT42972.1 hypothetical protein SODALDRAFT_355159 [Sodiomyces alkalinus F11]
MSWENVSFNFERYDQDNLSRGNLLADGRRQKEQRMDVKSARTMRVFEISAGAQVTTIDAFLVEAKT